MLILPTKAANTSYSRGLEDRYFDGFPRDLAVAEEWFLLQCQSASARQSPHAALLPNYR